jgi:small subunit ribosomal protein S8e
LFILLLNLFIHQKINKNSKNKKIFKPTLFQINMKKGKKVSGGKYISSRKKKKYEMKGQKRNIKIGNEKKKSKRVRGGSKKTFLLTAKFVNIQTGKKQNKKIEIKNVLETPSNKFLARQNIITKGAILETEIGKVKVTNRPTQEGTINGILIKE